MGHAGQSYGTQVLVHNLNMRSTSALPPTFFDSYNATRTVISDSHVSTWSRSRAAESLSSVWSRAVGTGTARRS